jgi:hypothetical protein|nr:MAG TPA: MqsA [Caudoviricetes sp.]
MFKEITANNVVDGERGLTTRCKMPSICPRCHTAVDAKIIDSRFVENEDRSLVKLFVTYFCPACECIFWGQYLSVDRQVPTEQSFIPQNPKPQEFSKNISSLSPQFVKIFNQAYQAESLGLLEICGIGYRRSLEFLVKDYAIHKEPSKSEEVKSLPLSKVVSEYMDSRLGSLAKAAVWLGNDETHYYRKHPDYDLKSLKIFLKTVVASIDDELIFENAQSLLNSQSQ